MPLADVVRASLEAMDVADEDAMTAALVVRYAELIDDAAPAGKYEEALDWLAGTTALSDDRDADKHARTIRRALARHSVASDLGPKLLAALDALLMTPRARAAARKAVTTPDDKPRSNPIDRIAQQRARRGRAETVDAATP